MLIKRDLKLTITLSQAKKSMALSKMQANPLAIILFVIDINAFKTNYLNPFG